MKGEEEIKKKRKKKIYPAHKHQNKLPNCQDTNRLDSRTVGLFISIWPRQDKLAKGKRQKRKEKRRKTKKREKEETNTGFKNTHKK